MFRKYLVLLFLLFQLLSLYAQKKPLDLEAVRNWPKIKYVSISNDGKYLIYSILRPNDRYVNFLRAVEGDWEQELPVAHPSVIKFTNDSRRLVFLNKQNDSLGIID